MMLLNRKTIISSLEKNWETLLAVYIKNDYSIYKHKTSSYFFDINLPTNYNYLFLAKITNLLCNTGQLKNILRQLAKNEFHHAHLITLFYKKDINKSIFFGGYCAYRLKNLTNLWNAIRYILLNQN
jgi:hypothetical protein